MSVRLYSVCVCVLLLAESACSAESRKTVYQTDKTANTLLSFIQANVSKLKTDKITELHGSYSLLERKDVSCVNTQSLVHLRAGKTRIINQVSNVHVAELLSRSL